MTKLLLVAALLISGQAVAADTYITFPLTSYHFDRSNNYNERNFGLGVETTLAKDLRFKGVYFENSQQIESIFIGLVYTPFHAKLGRINVDTGFMAGKVTGYTVDPLLVALPVVRFTYGAHGINLTGVPRARGGSGAIGLEYMWTWEKQ